MLRYALQIALEVFFATLNKLIQQFEPEVIAEKRKFFVS